MRNELVKMCEEMPGGLAPTTEGGTVPVGEACEVLAKWDLHENLDSHGAILFRRFWDHALEDETLTVAERIQRQRTGDDSKRAQHLDPRSQDRARRRDQRPRERPHPARRRSRRSTSGHAQRRTNPAARRPRRPQRRVQRRLHRLHQGRGFSEAYYGSSYVQAVTWNKSKCPKAATIMTYSQSDNPESPHYADQTKPLQQKGMGSGVLLQGRGAEAYEEHDGAVALTAVRGSAPAMRSCASAMRTCTTTACPGCAATSTYQSDATP